MTPRMQKPNFTGLYSWSWQLRTFHCLAHPMFALWPTINILCSQYTFVYNNVSRQLRLRSTFFGQAGDRELWHLTSKYVLGLLVWWASIVPILSFLGISVVELGWGTRQTDRQTERQPSTIYNAPPPVYWGGGIIRLMSYYSPSVAILFNMLCVSRHDMLHSISHSQTLHWTKINLVHVLMRIK